MSTPLCIEKLLQQKTVELQTEPNLDLHSFSGTLYTHQKRALSFALQVPKCMLALDMGLGKTIIGIVYALQYLPALIICPAGLMTNWISQLLFFIPDIPVNTDANGIYLCTYSKIHEYKAPVPFQCIIADEAHYLKSPTSRRSIHVKKLLATIDRLLLLTGTPAHCHKDLYHLLHLIDPCTFSSFFPVRYPPKKEDNTFHFGMRYCCPRKVIIRGLDVGYKFSINQRPDELRSATMAYILRMKKDDVVDLPRMTRSVIDMGQVPEETAAYFERTLEEIEELRTTKGQRIGDVRFMELCRETMHLKLIPITFLLQERYKTRTNDKYILFYHHQFIGDYIETFLQSEFGDDSLVRIDGKTPMKKRVLRLATFRDTDSVCFGLFSLCATSTGINLQFCCRVIYLELTFLSTHHAQSEARVHRIGQTQPVTIEYLLMGGTTDTIVWNTINRKRKAEATLFDPVRNSI